MWVSSDRSLTSPIANSHGRSGTRIVSSTVTGMPGSRPTVSRPRSSVRGRRPTATRISSPLTRSPSLKTTVTSAPSRADGQRLDPDTDVHAALDQRLVHLPAGERLLASKQSLCGLDQRDRAATRAVACAISTPTTPPPSTTRRRGDSARGGDLAAGPRPGLGEPRDRRDRGSAADRDHHCFASFTEQLTPTRSAALALETHHGLASARCRCSPARKLRRSHPRSWIDLIAAGKHRVDVDLAGHRLARRRERGAPQPARQPGAAAPWTAYRHSTSTRHRPAPTR